MYTLPIAAAIAKDAVARRAGSARPDAPVVPEPSPATSRLTRVRQSVAAGLHRAAGLVEPAPYTPGAPGSQAR